LRVIAQSLFDCVRWLIAAAQPDDLRRRTKESRHIREIRVLRNENVIVSFRIFPYGSILGLFHPEQPNLI